MDDYIKEMGNAIYRDRVRRARLQPPEEKMRDGPRLFDYACLMTLSGIRSRNPGASEERVMEILKEYIALQRRLENRQ